MLPSGFLIMESEALSRKIGVFSCFLELAVVESGCKFSNESGVSQPAVK